MGLKFAGPGVNPSLGGLPSNVVTLAAGQTWILYPAGWYQLKLGKYTVLQEYDPITTTWRSVGGTQTQANLQYVQSDGINYRIANLTGCAVGAVVTTAGSSITAPPTVTPSAGGSTWRAVVGGAVNTTVTVSNGGTGYTYPPQVFFSVPGSPGVQATGHATLSAGAVATVVVDNQGAGYTTPPSVTFVNDPREGQNAATIGINAAAVATLTGAGTITALLCLDPGTPLTAVPTFTWSPSGPAATAVMCWTITAYVVSATTAGSGYAAPVIISAYATPLGSSVLTNPTIQNALVKGRNAFIVGAISGSGISATGQTILDGGIYDQVPTVYIASAGIQGASAVQAVFLSPTMGGATDTSIVLTT